MHRHRMGVSCQSRDLHLRQATKKLRFKSPPQLNSSLFKTENRAWDNPPKVGYFLSEFNFDLNSADTM